MGLTTFSALAKNLCEMNADGQKVKVADLYSTST